MTDKFNYRTHKYKDNSKGVHPKDRDKILGEIFDDLGMSWFIYCPEDDIDVIMTKVQAAMNVTFQKAEKEYYKKGVMDTCSVDVVALQKENFILKQRMIAVNKMLLEGIEQTLKYVAIDLDVPHER